MVNEIKNAIERYYAIINLLFFLVILLYIEKKQLRKRKLITISLLNSKLFGKFQRFNAVGRSIEMLKNSWISKIFNQNDNFKIFYEPQTASCLKEIMHPCTRWKFSTSLDLREYRKFTEIWRFTGIYRHLISKDFKNAVLWSLEIVPCKCFSETNQKHDFNWVSGVYFL